MGLPPWWGNPRRWGIPCNIGGNPEFRPIGGGGGGAGWVAMTRLKLDKAANSSSKVSLSVPPSLNLLRLKIKINNEISKMYIKIYQ